MTPLNNNLDGNSMRLAAIMDDLQRTMVRCGYTIIVEEEGGLFFTLGRRWCLASSPGKSVALGGASLLIGVGYLQYPG